MPRYVCPHCLGEARQREPGGTIYCQGDKHCDFSGGEDEFEIHFVDSGPTLPTITQDLLLMPRSLTAKNGSKYTFSGEYKIRIEMKCSACYFDEPDPDCEVCGGGIDYIHTETLELTLIKEIYAKAVEALGQEVFEGKDHLGAVKKLNESKEYCAVCGGGLALSRHND